MRSRSLMAAAVNSPCLKLPLRSPVGAPLPFAPPCNLQRVLPLALTLMQGAPPRVLAPQRAARRRLSGSRVSRSMGLSQELLRTVGAAGPPAQETVTRSTRVT